jgi:hypothetical protein
MVPHFRSLHMKIYILHLKIYAPRMKIYTPRMKIYTLHMKIYAPRMKIYTPRMKTYTPRMKIYTLHMKIFTHHLKICTPRMKIYTPRMKIFTHHLKIFTLHMKICARFSLLLECYLVNMYWAKNISEICREKWTTYVTPYTFIGKSQWIPNSLDTGDQTLQTCQCWYFPSEMVHFNVFSVTRHNATCSGSDGD